MLRGIRATVAWHEARGAGEEDAEAGNGGSSDGSDGEPAPPPPPAELTLFAGHDVTLLPVLFAVGAWRCPPGDDPNSGGAGGALPAQPAWPGYGAALAFELYEDVEEEEAGTEGGGHDSDGGHDDGGHGERPRRWVVEVAHRPGAVGGAATKDFAKSEWVTLLSLPLHEFEGMLETTWR